jgi:hypothetical protein
VPHKFHDSQEMNNIVSESRICISAESDGGFLIINSLPTSSLVSIQNILEGCHFRDSSLTEKKTVICEKEVSNRWTPPTDACPVDETAILMMPDIRTQAFRTNNIKVR